MQLTGYMLNWNVCFLNDLFFHRKKVVFKLLKNLLLFWSVSIFLSKSQFYVMNRLLHFILKELMLRLSHPSWIKLLIETSIISYKCVL